MLFLIALFCFIFHFRKFISVELAQKGSLGNQLKVEGTFKADVPPGGG